MFSSSYASLQDLYGKSSKLVLPYIFHVALQKNSSWLTLLAHRFKTLIIVVVRLSLFSRFGYA
jgi:hypothetical protein